MADLRHLFDRVYPILVRFIYQRVSDTDQAEDIAQEAFVRLLEERPRNPEAWLFVVAGNLAKNVQRGERRRHHRLSLLAGSVSGAMAPDADRLALQREAAQHVGRALDALSERDRTLLLLHHEGVPYKTLAQVAGVRASSVAPLLARARRRFLRSLPSHPSHAQSPSRKRHSAS
jgi:RNA polymerase sigma factor (sigma-70 family)